MRNRTHATVIITSLTLALTAGCRSDRTEAERQIDDPLPKAAERVDLPQVPATQPPVAAEITAVVVVDTKLAALCAIPHTNVFFEFDAAKLQPEAKEYLDRITKCAQEGPAKGRELLVVGHTDPRGDEAYNEQLGMRRAESVASYLKEQGVAQPRIEKLSRGQELADPDEPASFPRDRRVTIRLAD